MTNRELIEKVTEILDEFKSLWESWGFEVAPLHDGAHSYESQVNPYM